MGTRVRFLPAIAVLLVLAFTPRLGSADSGPVVLSGFPALKQQHPLTCEASTASMGTQGVVTEGQLMAVMPRNPNPNLGFRGNPNGVQGTALVDYGVYAAPLQRALQQYGYGSNVMLYATRDDIKRSIDAGRPVVAWITYALQDAKPRVGMANGVSFVLVPHEHTVLVIGYDANTVVVNDPWVAKSVRYYWKEFERSWGLFGNMALAMDPCPTPKQVTRVAVSSIDSAGLTWTWAKAKNAAKYGITVTRHGTTDTVVLRAKVSGPSVTLPNPSPGASYQIAVRAISTCGVKAPPTQQWYDAPTRLPTPIPTPTVLVPTTTVPTSVPTPAPGVGVPTAVSETPVPSPTPLRTETR